VVEALVQWAEIRQQMRLLLQRLALAVLVWLLLFLAVKFFMLAAAVVAQIVVVQQA
jgi:hypothetical protein